MDIAQNIKFDEMLLFFSKFLSGKVMHENVVFGIRHTLDHKINMASN